MSSANTSKKNTPSVLNDIKVVNNSGLNASNHTVWVAAYMQESGSSDEFYILQSDGQFAAPAKVKSAPFIAVSNTKGLTIGVLDIINSGNNRLVFTVTPTNTPPSGGYPINGFTAYPFANAPGVCPPGPYDIFEFGPNAQYDVSAVDSFGINLTFTVKNDALTYGPLTTVSRNEIATAFSAFTSNDPHGAAFTQLLYSSPAQTGYPAVIEHQFSAIVSPKDWLAIYPDAIGLEGYWADAVSDFFTAGNQLNFQLNGATVGNYSGASDGAQYTLSGPDQLNIVIPRSDFAGNQPFIQAVRGPNQGESAQAYAAFGQIEAAIFEAFSRGVALDGVACNNDEIAGAWQAPINYSSDAWTDTANWFTDHANAYNGKASVYDVYAKFFHYSTATGTVGGNGTATIFGQNSNGRYGMAYGFSLDENPNVGNDWPSGNNTPPKTLYNVGSGQTVTINIGPWH